MPSKRHKWLEKRKRKQTKVKKERAKARARSGGKLDDLQWSYDSVSPVSSEWFILPPPPPPPPPAQESIIMPAELMPEFEEVMLWGEDGSHYKTTLNNPPQEKVVEDTGFDFQKEVQSVQQGVLSGLAKQAPDAIRNYDGKCDTALIDKINSMPEEQLANAVGEFMAFRLHAFCKTVDFNHPSIREIVQANFTEGCEFAACLKEIFALSDLSQGKELRRVLELVKGSFIKEKAFKDARNVIFKPYTRTLSTKELRAEARGKKTFKGVDMAGWFKNHRGWSDYPTSFVHFARLDDTQNTQVEENKKRAEKVLGLGMTSLADTFIKRNTIIAKFLEEKFLGFVKLKMVDAAVILAKMAGGILNTEAGVVRFGRKSFNKSPFWLEPDNRYPAIECGSGDPNYDRFVTVRTYDTPNQYDFQPRAYPLHEFTLDWPAHIQEVMNSVESHQDMNGKAVFDQFWVIVPGIKLTSEYFCYDSRWVLRSGKQCELYDDQKAATKALDLRLTKDGVIHPVVLGEKDGKCLFITYWS